MERMINHVLLVGFFFLLTYPSCTFGAAFPHRYGLHQFDRTSFPSITPSYRIKFMNRTSFPSGFTFGAASAAHQVEGAWNLSGKGMNNWDYFAHTYPDKIYNRSNADFACNSYVMYKEDVSLMKNLNMDSYRFSIAWSRVIPTGHISDGVNEEGIKYYLSLITELVENGLEPAVTLFHWDVPQDLEVEYGGFLSQKIVDDYRDYANLCFQRFGHLVKRWITFNEPTAFSQNGYDNGAFAPGRCSSYINPNCTGGDSSTEPYLTAHHQLLSHSAAVKLCREKYQGLQKGKIGITLVSIWTVPYTNSVADNQATARALEFGLGWFMDPVVFGRYPRSMRRLVGKRLPKFNVTQSAELKESFDFIGLNYYMAYYTIDLSNQTYTTNFSYGMDSRVNLTYVSANGTLIGPQAGSPWLHVYPAGIWKLLTYVKLKYNNPIVYITENGVDEINDPTLPLEESLKDPHRVSYYYQHLAHVLKAIHEGCNVMGYYAWSVIDNYEWNSGYSVRFGLTFVDFNDGFKRYPKLSSKWFKSFLQK